MLKRGAIFGLAIIGLLAAVPARAGLPGAYFDSHATYDWAKEDHSLDGLITNNVRARTGSSVVVKFDNASWDAYFATQKQKPNPGTRDGVEPFEAALLALGSFWQGYNQGTIPERGDCPSCIEEFDAKVRVILIQKHPQTQGMTVSLNDGTLLISVGAEYPNSYEWLPKALAGVLPSFAQYFQSRGW